MKVVALGVEVLAVILSGFNVFSENGIICEALGIPFTTGLICTVTVSYTHLTLPTNREV